MPELPEVETTVRGLRKHIVGRTIVSAWSDPKKPTKSLDGMSWNKRRRLIEGREIDNVTRRAKYIVIDFRGGNSLYVHQKMSGHLLVGRWKLEGGEWKSQDGGPLSEDSKNHHIRAMLVLENDRPAQSYSADLSAQAGRHPPGGGRGRALYGTSPKTTRVVFGCALSDTRRFATMTYVRDPSEHRHLSRLGPEPLNISLQKFHELFKKKKGRLKSVLMDPYFIVGIGNIYADEILWASGLHPLSAVHRLTGSDRAEIYRNMRSILARAIKMGGSSVDDYRTSSGEVGEFQNMLNAYQRTGEKCAKRDSGFIRRIVVGQRSTHFCPKHQKRK